MTQPQLKKLGIYASIALAASAGTLLAVRARAAGIPDADVLTYTGYLENPDGSGLTGKHAISVRFLAAVDATKALCTGDASNADLVSGRFQVPLPDCAAVVAANPNLFVDVQVDGAWLGPTKLGAVPYAIEAGHAAEADHAAAADTAKAADAAGGGLKTQIQDLDTRLTSLEKMKLSCQLRSGGQSKTSLFGPNSSIATCSADETISGGVCTPFSGKGGPIAQFVSDSLYCALANPAADGNDFVIAQAICCKK